VGARAFASSQALGRDVLLRAPVRWPRPSRLGAPLHVDGRRAAAGALALGLETVGALLEHLPGESREARTIAGLQPGEQATVAVAVRAIATRPVRRRGMRPLVEARVADATGAMRATFFNQPWLAERYPPGTQLLLHGRADGRGGFTVAHHAPAEPGTLPAGEEAPAASAPAASSSAGGQGDAPAAAGGQGDAVAHYPASEGITSTQILTLVRRERAALGDFPEPLPARVRVAAAMPDRTAALSAMHFPRAQEELELGRRRLAFEELLLTQLLFLRRRDRRRQRTGALVLAEPATLTARWLGEALPFELTGDQRAVIEEIGGDLALATPMQRLLMGEVGSGKTVVALYAMLRAVEHGRQAALMAPTETLAEQHFATLQRLLGGEPVAVALLTGSTPARRRADIVGKLASGELPLVVGTHALIEPDVRFAGLAVAVIDEQHRFGVRQRAALVEGSGGSVPHTLHMTATPIPRTLALSRYGDLDTSRLRELPQGRQPVLTRIVSGEGRARAYEDLRAELRAGRQAYVVCPLIEEAAAEGQEAGQEAGQEDAAGTLRAATAELERLRGGELEGFRLVLLHGGMRAREKQLAMSAFASGEADALIATTVVEVGIDVPNATVMLIENADRFGISQLHQLRGRVGRGEHRARCYLLGPGSAHGSPRLRALLEHADGFRLAEIDLLLRSEGELTGTRQSGVGRYRVARLPEDAPLQELAREQAESVLAADAALAAPEHALLADALEALERRASEGG
jgi:ATP-dependent DNA helicase RecG